MTRLYKRRVTLTVARLVPDAFFTVESNAVVIRDLRVAFSVQRSLESSPNTAEVTVSNLAERTRAAFQEKPLLVTLDAGYDDNEDRLFSGDLLYARPKKLPVDWEVTMQLGDGARAHRHARVRRSFKAGVKLKDALSETAASMGLRIPDSVSDARELLSSFSSGLTLEGPSERELSRLLGPTGLQWSVQDGALQILRDRDHRRDEAVVVSENTGMVGSPESGSPRQRGEQPTLTVSKSLDPRITPGCRIQVESKVARGLYRVERVTHVGDTHGSEWTTKIEAKPL